MVSKPTSEGCWYFCVCVCVLESGKVKVHRLLDHVPMQIDSGRRTSRRTHLGPRLWDVTCIAQRSSTDYMTYSPIHVMDVLDGQHGHDHIDYKHDRWSASIPLFGVRSVTHSFSPIW